VNDDPVNGTGTSALSPPGEISVANSSSLASSVPDAFIVRFTSRICMPLTFFPWRLKV